MMNEVRIIKALLKMVVNSEDLFSRFERKCLKMFIDFTSTTDELLALVIFCYTKVLRRSLRPQVL